MKRLLCILFAVLLLCTGCTAQPAAPEEGGKPEKPVSGSYCVLGVDGKTTFPERTALKYDFENGLFDFGLPFTDSSWRRKGELSVEGSRITAVSDRSKSVMEGDQLKIVGNYTWIFELDGEGGLRFVPDGSDVFDVYGTQLDAQSTLVRTGDPDMPLD